MTNKKFWVDAIERAIKTAAQSAILVVGQDVTGLDFFDSDWTTAGSFALGGLVLSLLFSVASEPIGPTHGTPSLVK